MRPDQPSPPDPNHPDRRRAQLEALPPPIAACVTEGQKLVELPIAERDLAWHVKAFYLGDLTALAGAVIRAERAHAA